MMIDVLMIGIWDWANTGWRFKRCLEHLGLKVRAFKGHEHIFKYPKEISTFKPLSRVKTINGFPIKAIVPELKPFAENSKVIHMIASTFIDPGVDLTEKKVVVQHSGVTYSLYAEKGNAVFNPIANATIMQFPGLMGLGAVNEHLIIYPVDGDFIKPDFEKKGDKLIIGHFPSNPMAKGTEKVLKVIENLKKMPALRSKFEYVGIRDLTLRHHISWQENLERMRKCDVIIETIRSKVYANGRDGYTFVSNGNGSRPFGDWGNTALEASAMGKVVITNCLFTDLYESEYKCKPPLYISNDKDMLELNLLRLILMDDSKLLEEKKRHREWAVKVHGIKPTAERLWNEVYKYFF